MRQIILASASPRRQSLLNQIGLDYLVCAADIVEPEIRLNPETAVVENAIRKVEAVRTTVPVFDSLILGADTVVVLDGNVLGKPKNREEAMEILSSLSGKMHIVLTGLALLDSNTGKLWTASEKTKVYFRGLSRLEIESYVASGAPLDKAGAYGIQDKGALFVERIEGCYYNVVGLPLATLTRGLESFGVSLWEN